MLSKSNKYISTLLLLFTFGWSTTVSAVDHSQMDHSQMGHHVTPPDTEPVDHSKMTHNHQQSASMPLPQKLEVDGLRDPYAFTDSKDVNTAPHEDMGDQAYLAQLIADRFESSTTTDAESSMIYDWQAWVGKTYDKLLVRAEGEVTNGQFRDARNEILWAHALSAFWDAQLGIRVDSGKGADRTWLALGVQGLAPYWLYLEATFYVNEQGRTAFRLETEYDLLITQRLILQPRAELNFYSQADASRLVSSGLSNVEIGARLRYELTREFAPYVGIEWASRFGSAATALREQEGSEAETRLVAGVHFWF